MLINAQRAEEVRVAIVSGNTLDEYQVAVAAANLARGNIVRGMVANLHTGLNAAFVDIGAERDGMLPAHDVVEQAQHRSAAGGGHPRVERVLERGRPILVQVTRDAVGSKGAALTTNISIAGRYLVLMPFEPARGISRKVEDEGTRAALRDQVDKLAIPDGVGVIVRTNALGQTKATLQRDLGALLRLWKRIQTESGKGKGPRLLYSDQDLVVQALRDYLDGSIAEVLVDDDEVFDKAKAYMESSMPRGKTRLVRYTERMPLFTRFQLEEQIDSIFQRTVPLPGGGSIVIDRTEALTAIDVNSGRAKGGSQEEAIYAVNLEAAREVARQLRLRDIGGLIVVDLIDMGPRKNRAGVEKALRDALKSDRARTTVGRISANGLIEINRQRIKQALALRTHRPCPTCGGTGTIPSAEFVGLSLLRRIEARAAGGALKRVRIALHPELADAFQNARRQELAELEREFDLRIEIIAMTSLHRSEERVEWVERDPDERPARPAAVVTAADFVGTPADASDKKRRRRRGGKRRTKTGAEPAAAPENETAEEAAPSAADVEAETAPSTPALGEAASKSKRRRRGGRGRRKAKSASTPASTEQPAGPVEATTLDPAPTAGPEPTTSGASTSERTRRRRHRPRRSRGRGAAAEAVTAETG
jgi:ribonuclease E